MPGLNGLMDALEKTIQFYEDNAESYAENVKGICPKGELDKFSNLLLPSYRMVLDTGCGSGVASEYLQLKGFQVTGVDLSRNLLTLARKLSPYSFFETGDMRRMYFQSGYFDGLVNIASLLHLEKKDVPKTIKEFNRVLKPGGIFYLSVKEGLGEGMENDKRYNGAEKYYSYFGKSEIRDLLEKGGFDIFDLHTIEYKDNYRIEHPWMNIFSKKSYSHS
jgi:SAM-dependent methyltransferase